MKLLLLALSVFAAAPAYPARAAGRIASGTPPSLSQPSLSPDASHIAFVANSAIWTVPAGGGAAHLLVADGGNDSRPLYSPVGHKLAFVSDVTGNDDLYVIDLDSGDLRQVTWADTHEQLDSWSRDGQWIYFSSDRGNVGGKQGVFRVRASGGTPMPVSREEYRNEASAAPSPDGKQLALIGGMGDFQWWRHGHSHIDESAVWLLRDDGSHSYRRLTPDDARAQWPMWAVDGQSLYYMSDRNGTENIWHLHLDGTQAALTKFTDGRVLWPAISADGSSIAFERGFGIWTVGIHGSPVRQVPITLSGAVHGPGVVHENFDTHFRDLRISPDGKKLAFIVHGEVFAANTGGGGNADRVTRTDAAEYDLAWAPDSRHIVYGSARQGTRHLYEYDFRDDRETELTSGSGEDAAPVFSPDGKSLAFVRDGRQLYVLDLASKHVRKLATGHINFHRPLGSDRVLKWSPDGRWIAYFVSGQRMFRNASAVRVADGHSVPLSFLANTFADDLDWSADGKALFFVTRQRTENGQVARIDLIARTPVFHEDKFHDLFKEEVPSPVPEHSGEGGAEDKDKNETSRPSKPEPVRIDPDQIRQRISLLPIGLDVGSIRISPDGKTLLVTADVAGTQNVYAWSLDPLAKTTPVARQLTSSSGKKSGVVFGADSKTVFYLDDGTIHSIALKDGSKSKALKIKAEMDVDFKAEKMVVFNQAWTWLRDNFHDPDMNGVDWDAVHAKYAPRIAGATTPAAMRRLLNLMVGELDASHSGVREGDKPDQYSGWLGLHFDRGIYERDGTLRITSIVPLSPAAVSGNIHVGDQLLAVDGHHLDSKSNLAQMLAHRVGRKTALRISGAHGTRDVEVKPISTHAEAELAYDAWTQANRIYVDRISHGRLGYVHLRDMSMDSLRRFYKDLDAQNSTRDGVVIDERDNFGGFVNAYALDVLARKPYLHMTFRGFDHAQPARSILGQRALERPTVLVTNRATLSDGEDFSQGYRTLGLGKVVGEPTAGWIIYTTNVPLIDGSIVRLPFITITDTHGNPMELHPRAVEVAVSRSLGESYQHTDSQLDRAVSTLMNEVKGTLVTPSP